MASSVAKRYVQRGNLWVPEYTAQMRGLGDLVARGLSAIGIKQKAGCGCSKRQVTLNRVLPFRSKASAPGVLRQQRELPPIIGGSGGPYYNGDTTDCPVDGSGNATDRDVLFCDGFEDGVWYSTNADSAGHTGGMQAVNNGWWGTIYFDEGLPYGNAKCGAGVTPFGNCAAWSGNHGGSTAGNGWHQYKIQAGNSRGLTACGSTGAEQCYVDEMYYRWYAKWDTGYSWGFGEKAIGPNQSEHYPDLALTTLTYNCGGDTNIPTAEPYMQVLHGTVPGGYGCGPQNQGNNITLVPNHWYFHELHFKGPAGGLVELWVNDCGTDPANLQCGAAPILRTRYTGFSWDGDVVGREGQTDAIFHDIWSVSSLGSGPYIDQVKASLAGPIGFAGAQAPAGATISAGAIMVG